MAPHLPWAGTLTAKVMPPSSSLEPRFCFSQASARAAYQVAADVATRDRGPHVEKNVEHTAAVRMVALGCAHDHVHRRGVLYSPLSMASPIPRRHMPPRLGKQLDPTPWRSRSLAPTSRMAAYLFRPRYRPKAGVEPSGGGPPPDLRAVCPCPCASAPMSSHIPLQCARAGLLLGASVGALSSRCDNAA